MDLFQQLNKLATEQLNPASERLDELTVPQLCDLINTEDHQVPIAVRRQLPDVARAVDLALAALQTADGRLLYFGAGTSGRLGVVDAAECPPTFGTDPDRVQGLIAGGPSAVFRSKEGFEDVEQHGCDAVDQQARVTARDCVIGLAASGRTPYVVGALRRARQLGAATVLVCCVPRAHLPPAVADLCQVAVCVPVGPEVLMGSTRMKAGTAQKLVLNTISTACMVRLGKVYRNMMVDLQLGNAKLVQRSHRVLMLATDCSYEQAHLLLEQSQGHVKTAIVMQLTGCSTAQQAQQLLQQADGHIKTALTHDAAGRGGAAQKI